MRVTLTVIGGPHTGQAFSFSGHDTFLVGRSKRAHFRLPAKDRYFSRVHFLVEVNPPQCRLMDMGSRNGTYVNGRRVEDTIDLKDQDQFIEGYHIVRPVGKGSMGVVYLAVRKKDDVLVALKTIIPAVHGTTAQLKRFLREAEILQQLSHPNIVSFRDSGQSGGKIFFAMDYVRGRDASQLLRSEWPLA